ncbi:BlaI/MecI/CopY family transcriptional regulator [Alteromonas aestuariivivens]|uniref:BlaI/MecI/CopY family transcriptional regulator n=1 Tax=Alteromonas aestuariivivens TaxID=1938339 RepID=A0A3D8M802_9ALTE|nr:BlaI/MecI/CopY family transcriptional regulator [Alteromonas aestuariivivens]RDV26015.1 BlaI/MecI/CopY family transcriptional regulator [Alteromonas aestuariivivens]
MKLSEFELDVMHYFWKQTQCSAKQIHQWIGEQKPVAYNTVKTIVDRLEEKGAIIRVGKDGRALLFQAAVTQEELTPSVLPNFIKRFFGGSAKGLITHIIDDDKLTDDEIEYLQQYLKDKKKQ